MASKTEHSQNSMHTFWIQPKSTCAKNPNTRPKNWLEKQNHLPRRHTRQALRLNEHVKVCIRKAKQARRALYPILNNRSPIPLPTRLSIYKLFIKPILLYASSAWGHLISTSNWAKIEAVQNVAIRIITGTHFLTRYNTILNPPINSLRNEAELVARVFHHRNAQSTFAHIRDIGTSITPQLHTRRSRPINFVKL